ncbi:ankyrin repeat domain-containing protein SOWAHB-like [Engraulis encrasicolus]|uniref:ankyrin repeat domain-containing protein SOWAHB-like n=1 Tax=Engraulis encrasicolus TaxID=184585 RepID=UPI002FD6F32A
MATDFTQESVLSYLRCNGERVKNADLLNHFKYYLKEDEDRAQNREQFKKFVNAVAVVNRDDDAVAYVVLRKKFRVPGRDVASGQCHIPKHLEEKPESSRSRHRERSPRRTATSRSRERRRVPAGGEASSKPKTTNRPHQVPPTVTNKSNNVLPAAGIVTNNNNAETVNLKKTDQMAPQQQTWEMSPPSLIITVSPVSRTLKPSPTPAFSPPESKRSSGSGQSFEQTWDKEPVGTAGQQVHNSGDMGNLGQLREADGCSSAAFYSPPDSSHSESDMTRFSLDDLSQSSELLQQVYQKSSSGGEGYRHGTMASAAWPLHSSLGLTPGISSSSPCIADVAPPLSRAAQPIMSASNDCLTTPVRRPSHCMRGETAQMRALAAVNTPFQRRSLPLDPSYPGDDVSSVASYPELYPTPLSSTHGCLAGSDCEWPFPLTQSQASWSSDDNLSQQRVLEGAPSSSSEKVKETLRRAEEAKLLALMHRPVRTVAGGAPHHHQHHHRSTGFLDQEMPSDRAQTPPAGSAVPGRLLRVPTHRGSQRLRGRMTRSLGAGLDQEFLEDTTTEAARQHRLMILSSSLSVNYPIGGTGLHTSPSSQDVSLSGASSTSSLTPCRLDRAFVQRTSPVPLEPHEHEWMVKAASGDWPSIYSLFRDDHSLLAKRDFISGYTVLHWIAKHGDHRVLNTLWYGVNKVGMALDVDAKTTCGYTPLHMAAMYGHKKLLRILVLKFKADVRLRDTSGRRAWQYLEGEDTPPDLLQMLGAPKQKKKKRMMTAKRPCSRDGSPHRHHDDGGSSEQPTTSTTTVKRHSSLAALFKHKHLARLTGHTEMSV